MVAENGFIRIFNPAGKPVWKKTLGWAVEVNPVWKYEVEAQQPGAAKKK